MNQVIELQEIASEIRSENDKIVCHARNMLESALRVGELLTQAKSLVRHGEWTQWIEENCRISSRQAQKYMQLYEGREQLAGKTASEGGFNLNQTLKLLSHDEDPSELHLDDSVGINLNTILEKAESQIAILEKTESQKTTTKLTPTETAIEDEDRGILLLRVKRTISVYCKKSRELDEGRDEVCATLKAFIEEVVDKVYATSNT